MNIYYPNELSRRNDEAEIISSITTPDIISINELKTYLVNKSYSVIVLLWSLPMKHYNYKELILRLTNTKNIVILIRTELILKTINETQFITLISNNIYNDAMIKFRINVKILKITFIAHQLSCNFLLNTSFNNKIIFIDPFIDQNIKIKEKNNIHIITFSDIIYDKKTKDIINSISSNIYTLNNTISSLIFMKHVSDLLLLNKIHQQLSKLYDALIILI